MQTFLPFPDFTQTAKALDSKRLGNQCYRECVTLINGKWPNHPASKMWRGHEYWLALYGQALATEMLLRGGWKAGVPLRWFRFFSEKAKDIGFQRKPTWLGDPSFHRAHQSNLIRKDPEHYKPLFPGVPDDLPYIWPSATKGSTGSQANP